MKPIYQLLLVTFVLVAVLLLGVAIGTAAPQDIYWDAPTNDVSGNVISPEIAAELIYNVYVDRGNSSQPDLVGTVTGETSTTIYLGTGNWTLYVTASFATTDESDPSNSIVVKTREKQLPCLSR